MRRYFSGLFLAGPWPKLGKNDRLNIKMGEINYIEHNKGSKIYPQNQVILDCILLYQAYHLSTNVENHSDMGHCFS